MSTCRDPAFDREDFAKRAGGRRDEHHVDISDVLYGYMGYGEISQSEISRQAVTESSGNYANIVIEM